MVKRLVVIKEPGKAKAKPKSPGWWRTFGLKTGTVVRFDNHYWRLVECWSWMDYNGRGWERVMYSRNDVWVSAT